MRKKPILTFAIIILAASALIVINVKSPASRAQTSNQTWQLTITGLVENPLNLTLSDIEAMPPTSEYAALFCVDAPTTPLAQGNWTGVQLSYLLQLANVSPEAFKVALFAPDGFTTDFTVQKAMQDTNILVAYQKDNVPLSGLRLVVPFNWGYKWINYLEKIQLVNYNFLGTEESLGYADDGTTAASGIQSNQFTAPFSPSTVPPDSSATSSPNSSPTPLAPLQSSTYTSSPTASPENSNPTQLKSSTFAEVAIASVILAVSAVAAAVLIKRKSKASKHGETIDLSRLNG